MDRGARRIALDPWIDLPRGAPTWAMRPICRVTGRGGTEYKSDERKKIVDAGYHIIPNVGDQLSDMNGDPQAERSVKLPNPFYCIL